MSTFTRRDILVALTAGALAAGAVTIARDPNILLGLDRPRDSSILLDWVSPPNRELHTVDGVIDGETIDVKDEHGGVSRVRMLGIYTPEVGHGGRGIRVWRG